MLEKLEFSLRPSDPLRDTDGVLAIDTSYLSAGYFKVSTSNDTVILALSEALAEQLHRFPIDLQTPNWSSGWVAESQNRVIGFIATEFAAWNRRSEIAHFYVHRPHRRRGVGSALMHAALSAARAQGALSTRAETSNFNLPGIAAYRRMGFELSGFDQTLYAGTPAANQFAIYLSRNL